MLCNLYMYKYIYFSFHIIDLVLFFFNFKRNKWHDSLGGNVHILFDLINYESFISYF